MGTYAASTLAHLSETMMPNAPAPPIQVMEQCKLPEGTRVEFTEMLFQPVPWSPTTKRGMPAQFERYLDDPSYLVINVPPNFIFKVC